MQKFKEVAVLVNNNSRKSRHSAKDIRNLFKKNDIEVARFHKMTGRQSFKKALTTEKEAKPDLLVIGGGDGTIHSIINEVDLDKTTIAILPLGTVNNFARSLGVNSSLKKAVSAIAGGETKQIHLGSVNGHLFTNLSAIGISVKVAQNVSDKSKRFLGRLAYYIQGVYEAAIHKPFMCELKVDDRPTQRFYTHQIVVANGKYHGPVRFTANESIESGHLTTVIFGRTRKRLAHLKNIMYFVIPGWVKAQPLVVRGKNISIITEPSRAVEVDGEAVSQTPAEYELIEKGMKVIYSPRKAKTSRIKRIKKSVKN